MHVQVNIVKKTGYHEALACATSLGWTRWTALEYMMIKELAQPGRMAEAWEALTCAQQAMII